MNWIPWLTIFMFGTAVFLVGLYFQKTERKSRIEKREQDEQLAMQREFQSPVAAVATERLSPQSPVGPMRDWGSKQQGQKGPYHN